MYESVIDLINGEATMLFIELQYTLATEEAERIGVDHVARMSTADTGESSNGKLRKYFGNIYYVVCVLDFYGQSTQLRLFYVFVSSLPMHRADSFSCTQTLQK